MIPGICPVPHGSSGVTQEIKPHVNVIYFKAGHAGAPHKRVVGDNIERASIDSMGVTSWTPSFMEAGDMSAIVKAMANTEKPLTRDRYLIYGVPHCDGGSQAKGAP